MLRSKRSKMIRSLQYARKIHGRIVMKSAVMKSENHEKFMKVMVMKVMRVKVMKVMRLMRVKVMKVMRVKMMKVMLI